MRTFFVLLLLLGVDALAQNKFGVHLCFQNDYINYRFSGTDRYYTGGIGLGVSVEHKNKKHFLHSLLFDQKIFTPKNTDEKNRVPNDYPYGSLLFTTYSITKVSAGEKGLLKAGFSFGTTGKDAGGELFQNFVHQLVNDRFSEGWNNEVLLGNYFQFLFSAQQFAWKNSFSTLSFFTDNNVGKIYNVLNIGLEYKIGDASFCFLEHRSLLSPKNQKRVFYFFIRPYTTFVFKNKLLESGLALGKNRIGPRTEMYAEQLNTSADFVELIKRRTAHAEAGFCLGGKHFLFEISQHFQSPEFTGQEPHEFGEISVLYRF
jgi:hypothetical protein